ncbi:exocyst complex component EXO70B1-like protein [Tanacetum coccineum]
MLFNANAMYLYELDWDSITCVDKDDGETLDWDSITCVDEDGETLVDLNFLPFSEVVNADDDICELDWDSITCVDEDGETLVDLNFLPFSSRGFMVRLGSFRGGILIKMKGGKGYGAGGEVGRESRDRMIKSGYEKECCQVYCNMRREVLDECLVVLGVERLSIEEVQCVDWKVLDEKLRNGFWRLWVVVRVLLFWGEKIAVKQCLIKSVLIQEFSDTSLVKNYNKKSILMKIAHGIQTVWKVPDEQLREELRIFISEKVLQQTVIFREVLGSRTRRWKA